MRMVFASLLGVFAASCMHAGSGSPPARASTGYICKVSHGGDFGMVSTEIRIRDGEQPSGYVQWDVGDGSYRNPWITASWFMSPERTFDLGTGYSNVMWHIWDYPGERRNTRKKLQLEFRVDDNPRRFGNARIATPPQRSGGPFHINVEWPTISTLAAGTDELFLVALDEQGAEKSRVEIDPRIYAKAEAAVVPVMREIEGMLASPATRCQRHDFSAEDSIVLA